MRYDVSIHAFRGEGDVKAGVYNLKLEDVSIHAFRGEGDRRCVALRRNAAVSIHAFRGEGDLPRRQLGRRRTSFNPRLPGGRRLSERLRNVQVFWFQSTPSGGKATLHVGLYGTSGCGFQSTPSGGKATRRIWWCVSRSGFQSTPSGGKATPTLSVRQVPARVSIHAFRGEGDSLRPAPVGGLRDVSIHAFRGEGDARIAASRWRSLRFNPRLPGGRRLADRVGRCRTKPAFQSTPSGGKATQAHSP